MFDIERIRKNIDLLDDWLSTRCIIIYNEFTIQHEHIRHIRLADDAINIKLLDNSDDCVELLCTCEINIYTQFENVFLRIIISKQVLEILDTVNTNLFRIKSNRETYYNRIVDFDIDDCGNACLSGI